ncbi:3-deoxy-7-phosphoheptulonate synthase [Thermococci archaeon]|nr:MAG: 3-deoxy-7-phosphoheptulonate synthase [Thermococci archaeon]
MNSSGERPSRTVKIRLQNENSLYGILLSKNSGELKKEIERISEHNGDTFYVDFPEPVVITKDVEKMEKLSKLPGVKKLFASSEPYILASKQFKRQKTIIEVGEAVIGEKPIIIAGPCSVESEEQVLEIAKSVKRKGGSILRGGAFKPRTSPYSFQGLGEEGLRYLAKAREETGLPIVTEVMDTRDIPLVAKYADILQIGSRNMQNFSLLKEVGKQKKPVLLKRGMNATIKEFLLSAEYIMVQGNPHVILCERGIKTFETATRNTLDLSAVPVLNELTYLPVIIDPSHATGNRRAVIPMAKAAIAAGADGVMVEVHNCPSKALCDGSQSLTIEDFEEMMDHLRRMEEICAPLMQR